MAIRVAEVALRHHRLGDVLYAYGEGTVVRRVAAAPRRAFDHSAAEFDPKGPLNPGKKLPADDPVSG